MIKRCIELDNLSAINPYVKSQEPRNKNQLLPASGSRSSNYIKEHNGQKIKKDPPSEN